MIIILDLSLRLSPETAAGKFRQQPFINLLAIALLGHSHDPLAGNDEVLSIPALR
jgi:hypothetical protein